MRRGVARGAVAAIVITTGLAVMTTGCSVGGSAPNYGPFLDRMEKAVAVVQRFGEQQSAGPSCSFDSGDGGYVERRYHPVAGTTMLEAERAIYDYFLAHGFDDNYGGLSKPAADEQDWTLEAPGVWLHGTHLDEQYEHAVDYITVRIEKQAC
jgi:hypothetical protein